jgi:hypothetical protein
MAFGDIHARTCNPPLTRAPSVSEKDPNKHPPYGTPNMPSANSSFHGSESLIPSIRPGEGQAASMQPSPLGFPVFLSLRTGVLPQPRVPASSPGVPPPSLPSCVKEGVVHHTQPLAPRPTPTAPPPRISHLQEWQSSSMYHFPSAAPTPTACNPSAQEAASKQDAFEMLKEVWIHNC